MIVDQAEPRRFVMVVQQAAIIKAARRPARRNRMSRASSFAIGASIAVHAVIAAYLYNAVFSIPLTAPPNLSPVVISGITHALPDKAKPVTRTPAARNDLHRPVDPGLTTPDTFPSDPPKAKSTIGV